MLIHKWHIHTSLSMLVVNCKNYRGMAGAPLERLADAAVKLSDRHNIRIALAPPLHMAGLLARHPVEVLAQHVDTAAVGGTTGHIVPELLLEAGVDGAIINHSEHRVDLNTVRDVIARLRKCNLISIVCTQDAAESATYAKMDPDFVAVEPPDLIGTGKSVSTHRPSLISDAAKSVESAHTKTRLLCGAGVVTSEDVSRARELGSDGILVASGVVKAADPEKALSDMAGAMA